MNPAEDAARVHDPAKPSVLAYADHPAGGRLVVERDDAGGLVVTDPATGVWEQLRQFGLWIGGVLALQATLIVFFAWRFGFSLGTARRISASLPPVRWLFIAEVSIALLVMAAMCVFAGTWSRTYRVRGGALEIETVWTWPRRWTRRRSFARGAIAAVRAARFRSYITIMSVEGKRVDLMVMRRADAAWLARVLACELGIGA